MKSFIKCHEGYQMKAYMGRACCRHGGEKCVLFEIGTREGSDYTEVSCVEAFRCASSRIERERGWVGVLGFSTNTVAVRSQDGE